MVFSNGLLLIASVISLFVYSRGLEFSITRTPTNQVCGHLLCKLNTDQNDQSIFSIIGMTIYDVTQATSTKEKVASITLSVSSDQELHVEPSKSDSVNAAGSISRYQADLTLDLRRATDCLNSSFLCELDFMNTAGQLDSQEKTVAPMSSNCQTNSCELSGTFSDLTDRTNKLEEYLTKLLNEFNDLETKLDNYLNGQHGTMPTETTVITSTSKPATAQTPPSTISSCTAGIPHTNPREEFSLFGSINALCDTETDGGGWVIIQRRTKGDVDFYRGWNDYKNGFGTPDTDFWIGNDNINRLSSQGYTELRIDLEYQGNKVYAHYSSFSVSDESSSYKLTVSGYSGTAGDSFSYHSDMAFTTTDRDNDAEVYYNCGEYFHGAWWYKDCFESNLNGAWGKDTGDAMIWRGINPSRAVSVSEMKVRHK